MTVLKSTVAARVWLFQSNPSRSGARRPWSNIRRCQLQQLLDDRREARHVAFAGRQLWRRRPQRYKRDSTVMAVAGIFPLISTCSLTPNSAMAACDAFS